MDVLFSPVVVGRARPVTVEVGSPEKVGRKVVSGETPIARFR